MQPKDILEPLVKLGLPLLGAVLPIPGGAAIGAEIASHIGSPSSAPEDILKTLQGSAEAVLKAKQYEMDNRAKLLELTYAHEERLYQAEVDDRKSARQREVDTKDTTVGRLAWTLIGGFLAVSAAQIIAVLGWPDAVAKVPPQGWLLIGNLSGYLANEAKQAAAYYFGSSVGSKDKDATLAEIAKAP